MAARQARSHTREVPVEIVFIAEWEMACCGDPFAVGSRVSWHLTPAGDKWLSGLLDRAPAGVTTYFDNHFDGPEPPVKSGVVRSIGAVSCRYRKRRGALVPVAGSETVRPIQKAEGGEIDGDGPERFIGYIVELETLTP